MKKKLLIGIIVVFVIAAAVLGGPFSAGPLMVLILLAVCLYLVRMIRKKKTKIFHDQMEPKIAERRLKRLKAFLLVAGISLAVFIVGGVLHNALSVLLEKDEPVSFLIAIFSVVPFAVGTIGGLVIFLKGRQKTT